MLLDCEEHDVWQESPVSSQPVERLTVLFVDYENVQKVDLSRLPKNMHVKIFVGNTQRNIPFEQVKQAQDLGSRLEWIKIESNGRNALDFHIAFFLGKEIGRIPEADFVILSGDKGFDPLVRYLNGHNFLCRRVNSVSELVIETAPVETNFTKVCERLAKIEKSRRPRKRPTLTKQIESYFQKKLGHDEVEALVEMLFSKNLVTESNKVLTYHF